jgi:alkylhydroperoxidase family enzyme
MARGAVAQRARTSAVRGRGEAERDADAGGRGGLAAVRTLGFDDRACLEVAHVVGIFNYLTRLADGLGLQLDAGTRAAAESGIPLKRRV